MGLLQSSESHLKGEQCPLQRKGEQKCKQTQGITSTDLLRALSSKRVIIWPMPQTHSWPCLQQQMRLLILSLFRPPPSQRPFMALDDGLQPLPLGLNISESAFVFRFTQGREDGHERLQGPRFVTND
jgi:hypothetical protein